MHQSLGDTSAQYETPRDRARDAPLRHGRFRRLIKLVARRRMRERRPKRADPNNTTMSPAARL